MTLTVLDAVCLAVGNGNYSDDVFAVFFCYLSFLNIGCGELACIALALNGEYCLDVAALICFFTLAVLCKLFAEEFFSAAEKLEDVVD